MLDSATAPDFDEREAAAPDRVVLRHRLFSLMPDCVFQLAPDGVPVMAMPIGDRRALIPVGGLMAELGISHRSEDGRMLALLPDALTYVNWLGLNDPLPPEIVTGQASWSPDPEHLTIAVRRVHNALLRWLNHQGAASAALVRAAAEGRDDPEIRRATQLAFERAAATLRMTSAGAVIAEAEVLAREMAFIEALRETLLHPVQAMTGQIRALGGGGRLDMARADLRASVLRLMGRAQAQLSARFADADAVLDGDIIVTIRDADLKAETLRAARDGLHRSRRAWTAMLDAWDEQDDEDSAPSGGGGTGPWRRMELTYRFLAPRFMPIEEWAQQSNAMAAGPAKSECVLW